MFGPAIEVKPGLAAETWQSSWIRGLICAPGWRPHCVEMEEWTDPERYHEVLPGEALGDEHGASLKRSPHAVLPIISVRK